MDKLTEPTPKRPVADSQREVQHDDGEISPDQAHGKTKRARVMVRFPDSSTNVVRSSAIDEDLGVGGNALKDKIETVQRHFYYCNRNAQDCLEEMSSLFEKLVVHDIVTSVFGTWSSFVFQPYVSEDHFTNFHNSLDAGTCWKHVSQWDTRITFHIRHPSGTIYARDTNKGAKTELYQDSISQKWSGYTDNKQVHFCIHRHQHRPVEGKLNIVNYFFVDIESTRVFVYESDRASWVFRLSVVWSGQSKEVAKREPRRFQITLESVDSIKSSADPVYSTSSFMEKILDICGRESTQDTKLILTKAS
jgi:hypothetical protein